MINLSIVINNVKYFISCKMQWSAIRNWDKSAPHPLLARPPLSAFVFFYEKRFFNFSRHSSFMPSIWNQDICQLKNKKFR